MTARFVRFGLPALAAAMFALAVWHVARSHDGSAAPAPARPRDRPASPFGESVAGAGLVEPETQSISVGSPLSGVVASVSVRVGAEVKAGAELFRLDDRETRARLAVLRAAAESARADLRRLESEPRPEEIPIAAAKVSRAEATVADARRHLERVRRLLAREAATLDDVDSRQAVLDVAEADLAQARAELALLRAGAWGPERDVAAAGVARADAEVAQAESDLDRLVVRAPVDGEALQVNVRPGEFAGAAPGGSPVVLGSTRKLHVRVDVDEQDIPRFRPGAEAVATLKGRDRPRLRLSFVRVEPFVIPKRSLTGAATERVDTRVLQVVYRVEPDGTPLYVGQQLDVFIKAGPTANEPKESAGGERDRP